MTETEHIAETETAAEYWLRLAQEKHPKFTIPDPLVECSTEKCPHAAFYSGEGGFWCGMCGSRKSIFRNAMPADDVRQRAADAALTGRSPIAEQVRDEVQKLERELGEPMPDNEKPPADELATATAGLKDSLTEIGKMLKTPERQEKAIELWEEMWHERVPEVGTAVTEMANFLDQLDRPLTEEEVDGIADPLRGMAKLIEAVSSENAPNPQLVAIYYLRRIESRLADIGEDLNVRFKLDEERHG